jgi:hypothetical protein
MSKHVWFIALAASLHRPAAGAFADASPIRPACRLPETVVTITGTGANTVRKTATNEGDYVVSF